MKRATKCLCGAIALLVIASRPVCERCAPAAIAHRAGARAEAKQ